jgi:hypothetical protein
MDLVTVVCEQDFDIMRLQAESINKFVEPCTHWITVNERFPNKQRWRDMLEPFYTKHRLILMFPKWYEHITTLDGFRRHQVYKLKMVKYIKDEEFLCLDPKDFFVRQCSTDEWKGVLGCGKLSYDPYWDPVIKRFAKKLNMPLVKENQFASECPFVWKTELMHELGDIDKFCKWYLKGEVGELVLYSCLANHLITDDFIPRTFGQIFWRTSPIITREVIDQIYNNTDHRVMGFHRYVRYRASDEELNVINNWLKELGFKTTIERFKPDWAERLINRRYYKEMAQFRKNNSSISSSNTI